MKGYMLEIKEDMAEVEVAMKGTKAGMVRIEAGMEATREDTAGIEVAMKGTEAGMVGI